ncbi:hypothetical protein LSCM1_02427 [Leishmania martiniquensis]|uniref:HECT domain-containing protein n=1 Tax=Leishmania martiniquensis TaxID=1580590 RepID=A0A836FSJ4_9TRYP|nr:hypothetical protein LSCM1_02427 [Leishmania martiniquensis]
MASLSDVTASLADEEAYTSLLEVCTQLIIAEGTDELPLKQPLAMLHKLLHCEHLSGDATVLSVRAVRILLEKFIPVLSSKSRAKLVGCVRAALQLVSRMIHESPARGSGFEFVHTKRWELQEELLQCMSVAAQGDELVQAALPPLQEQLDFCKMVMDVSLDMCLQALRMCCLLLRSAQLSSEPHFVRLIRDVLRRRLAALESMEMNQDWLRLLRHLTEGAVTLRAYAGKTLAATEANVTLSSRKGRKRKRNTDPNSSHSERVSDEGVDGDRHEVADEALVLLLICQRACVTPSLDRVFRNTVFSCANAILSDASRLAGVPADICVSVAMDLARELTRNVRSTLTIANPFAHREAASGVNGSIALPLTDEGEDDDGEEGQGEDLLSNGDGAKWHLPEPEWPLLILIANIFAAKTVPVSEHMWWSVGDDEYARRFAKRDRLCLTNAFFAAQRSLTLKTRGCRVNLSTMREFLWPFDLGCKVLFQPVSCAYTVALSVPAAPSLQCSPARARELSVALHARDVGALLEHLGAALHNGGDAATYSQSVLLQVLMIVGPQAKDTTRATLRSFLADAATSLIELVSEALVHQDRAWASTLLEAGVTETILRRSASVTPERSPVVQMLRREAASQPSTPPLLPRCELPRIEPAELRRVLHHGDRSDVEQLLEALKFSEPCAWDTAACSQVVYDLAGAAAVSTDGAVQMNGTAPAPWVRRLEHLLTGLVVKRLQDMALHFQQSRTLKQIVEESEVVEVTVCSKSRSDQFTCPREHPLHHHHGCNWSCDGCSVRGLQDAWSCRECDYDLCATCARTLCNRVNGAVTATAQDLLASWLASDANSAEATASSTTLVLFTEERGLISASTPLACLHRQTVHIGEFYAPCPCGLLSPGPAVALEAAAAPKASLLGALIAVFGRTCGQDGGVQRRLLKAYESAGAFVFLGGARAVPAELRCLTTHLAPHLPLSVKHLITRYVTVDCRRFAFQILHEQAATVMSTNTGVAPESSKLHKFQVPRTDKSRLLQALHDSFSTRPSPLVKMDFTFEGEEGFGSGPSQEVYTELSAYFRATSKFWFVTEDDGGASPVMVAFPTTKALFLREFFALGAACARSFIDDYRMDMDLVPQAWPLLMLPSLGLALPQNTERCNSLRASTLAALMGLLEVLDPSLHRGFAHLQHASEAELAAMELEMDDGSPLQTHAALEQHLQRTVATRFEVALENLRHFQWGLLSVMELEALWCLSDEERSAFLCGSDAEGDGPLFTEAELRAQTTVGNGYSSGSVHVEMLLSIVGGDFTRVQQHHFLEFLTGSPRLPFNGLAGLGRLITVAMKDMESTKEQTLPSCNTCFLYLKLPPYTTREIMKERLLFAVTEGRRNYSLS